MYTDKHLLLFHYCNKSFTGAKNITPDEQKIRHNCKFNEQNSGFNEQNSGTIANFNATNFPKREIKVLARKTCYTVCVLLQFFSVVHKQVNWIQTNLRSILI